MLPQEAVEADSISRYKDRLDKFRYHAWWVLKGLSKDAPSDLYLIQL